MGTALRSSRNASDKEMTHTKIHTYGLIFLQKSLSGYARLVDIVLYTGRSWQHLVHAFCLFWVEEACLHHPPSDV